ncbi:para-aminobenzoate synthase [Polyplosphaeria fusca]|uniref:p-aminobenzoic acid synthase n=1 Tax=Polyplosphaeria fusca TaxID=682080 RepID=A0A9P4R4W8_9PLEO|nr:para-aminobenzoate synthase [Polyplosphaeria fusca]
MSRSNGFATAVRWLAHELGIETMASVGKDVYILILARYLRLFAYGAIALILAVYFESLGFSDEKIGLFMTLTLLGDVVISLLLTLVADTLGRRRMLFFGALMMAVSGAVFATTSNYVALLMAAIIGVISPSGNEIGPFRAIEESMLAHLVPGDKRADVFTWYVVMAVLGTSTGLVVGGFSVDLLASRKGWDDVDAYRTIFWIYTAVGCTKAILTLFLGQKCEIERKEATNDEAPGQMDESEPLLNGHNSTHADDPAPAENTRRRFNPFSSISKPSRTILIKLCSLFVFDSLGSGMVPFSLINFYMERKFDMPKGKLGGIMSATWFVSTIGNVFASSVARRLGLIQAMVATHLPSSVFLALLPVPTGLPLTICLLVGRSVLNSMDQAPRSAFISLVVLPEERTAVMGIVNILKILSQSSGPWVTGLLAGHGHFWVAFVAAGSIKAAYDLGLLALFAGRVHERTHAAEEPVDEESAEVAPDVSGAETNSGIESDGGNVIAHSAAPEPNIRPCAVVSPSFFSYRIIVALFPQMAIQDFGRRNKISQPSKDWPKILYLDAYDSFANNIVALVKQCTGGPVHKIFIDDSRFQGPDRASSFARYLRNFDAVIAGPGPGWASDAKDVGLIQELWKLEGEHIMPVLGICLGFQSMATAFGATITTLNEPKHGIVSEILHKQRSIFRNIDQILAVQYHSLQVDIQHPMQVKRAVHFPGELWKPSDACPLLEPLAWDFDHRANGAVLMGLRHVEKPFWGVQFHPESICTNNAGRHLIQNWCKELISGIAAEFAQMAAAPAKPNPGVSYDVPPFESLQESWKLRYELEKVRTNLHQTWSPEEMAGIMTTHDTKQIRQMLMHGGRKPFNDIRPEAVHCATTGSGRLTVADVCETFDIPRTEAIVLESGLQSDLLPLKVGTGRYSIIGLVPRDTARLHYHVDSGVLELTYGNGLAVRTPVSDVWPYLQEIMKYLKPRQKPVGPTYAPFWGGLMGYVSYEAGLETIDVIPPEQDGPVPDICFAYITRSIVIDHQVKKVYVQSIRGPEDKAWVSEALDEIYEAVGRKSAVSTPSSLPNAQPRPDPFDGMPHGKEVEEYLKSSILQVAESASYQDKVRECQRFIGHGHSYELCLTTRNEIHAPRPEISNNNELSWHLYHRLTKQNTAPFSAYMRLGALHILSSSPERYISWDRNGTAQCRPIKGTVQKRPGVTLADATHILSSPKERAENLMIVDLVRHQLHGVYGAGNVRVSQLMDIEEYETLWQLVSVVDAVPPGVKKARTPDEWEEPLDYVSGNKAADEDMSGLGYEAFVRSLPPGSMTGAPKKRSCEILKGLEGNRRRGVYAGVLGYLDVGGGGDFSVVIRTAVKVDSGDDAEEDVWMIGAGGAVTAQSTAEAEFDEMLGKFHSTARAFTGNRL